MVMEEHDSSEKEGKLFPAIYQRTLLGSGRSAGKEWKEKIITSPSSHLQHLQ